MSLPSRRRGRHLSAYRITTTAGQIVRTVVSSPNPECADRNLELTTDEYIADAVAMSLIVDQIESEKRACSLMLDRYRAAAGMLA